ncbi:MAG: hypothetical protein JRH18_15545 [Deltaproteobacteria bacterium]|nr:hypothetical protein [Deltaproteobacteria bacterium]MBW2153071.1 hypothetical protein [Deltaproteobacteria bacterium]
MNNENRKHVYLFAHLPKTGGQTLRDHFAKHMKLHEDFVHLGPWGFKIVSQYHFDMHIKNTKNEDFFDWYKRRIPNNTICRWLLIVFMKNPGKIIEGLTDQELFERAVNVFKGFWLVGLTEYLDLIAPYFLKKLALPQTMARRNVTGRDFPRKIVCTPELRELIAHNHAADMRLYAHRKRIVEDSFFRPGILQSIEKVSWVHS